MATLSANVLHPLSVTNRKNVFVYASGSDVFYMRLFDSEEDGTVHLSPAMSIDNVTAVTATGQSTPTEERTTPLDSPSAVPLSASSQRRPTNCLRLEVYGASPLPKSVTDEFVSMIDSKVASLTLATISTLLARNITLKLSQSDADFVLPPTKQPHARMVFAVPHNVTEVHLLLSLLKHNLQSFLVTCNSAELISNLNQYFIAERQDEATTSDRAER